MKDGNPFLAFENVLTTCVCALLVWVGVNCSHIPVIEEQLAVVSLDLKQYREAQISDEFKIAQLEYLIEHKK